MALPGNQKGAIMTTVDEILSAARSLSTVDRSRLIAALWDSESPADWLPPDEEWIAEANRRSTAVAAGEMTASSWADVRARARRRASLDD